MDATTYNRFLLTAGIALIAIGLLAPSFVLQVSSGPLLSSEERANLSTASLDALEMREHLVDTAFDIVFPVSSALVVGGIVVLGAGALRARKRQDAADRKEDLEIRVLENQVREASPEERASKRQVEVAETVQEEIEEHVVVKEPNELFEVGSLVERESAIKADYASVELLTLRKLQEAFPSSRIHLGVAIESSTGPHLVDALIQREADVDIVVEVKYQTAPISTRGNENARRLLASVEAYESGMNATARGLLMYVLPPELSRSPQRKDFETRLATRSFEGWVPSTRHKVHLLVIGKDELEAMDSGSLAKRITQS